MLKQLMIAARVTLITLVLTGILYPLAVTGAAQALFPEQAAGSLVEDDRGNVVGSSLLGQKFETAAYFQGRPSASGYDAQASGGYNWSPTSAKLKQRIADSIRALEDANPGVGAPPDDLVTASASGLDPHLSPAATLWQVPRVARARGMEASRLETLVRSRVEGRTLGFLGEPRVNVLELNLALDRMVGRPAPPPPPGEGAAPAAQK